MRYVFCIDYFTTFYILTIYKQPYWRLEMKTTSFRFDEKTTQLIDDLKERSHASSRTEVLRKALYLLDLAAKAQEDKKRLVIKGDEDETEKEILMY